MSTGCEQGRLVTGALDEYDAAAGKAAGFEDHTGGVSGGEYVARLSVGG